MKSSWLTTGLAAVALCATATVGASTIAASAADKGPLTVVTDPSFVPFEMRDNDSGKMVGFDMDILHAIAKRAGFTYNLKTMNFDGIIPALQAGQADMSLAGITITKPRSKIVDFSKPYYDSGLRILVRKGNDKVHSLKDLEGKTIGTKLGTTSVDYLKKHMGDKVKVTPYPDGSSMYLALMSRNVDAVFFDKPNVEYFAKTKGQGKVKTVGKLYEGQAYGIAIKKGSPWLAKVNKALTGMKSDGSYAKIYKKWFGTSPSDSNG